MPTYDYLCEDNGQVVEVRHRMNDVVNNWGELCVLAGIEPGDTPVSAGVRKKIGAASVHTPKIGEWKKTGKKPKIAPRHTHGPGCGCGH